MENAEVKHEIKPDGWSSWDGHRYGCACGKTLMTQLEAYQHFAEVREAVTCLQVGTSSTRGA